MSSVLSRSTRSLSLDGPCRNIWHPRQSVWSVNSEWQAGALSGVAIVSYILRVRLPLSPFHFGLDDEPAKVNRTGTVVFCFDAYTVAARSFRWVVPCILALTNSSSTRDLESTFGERSWNPLRANLGCPCASRDTDGSPHPQLPYPQCSALWPGQ